MEIRETNWGIANNFGDYIEINRNLKEYPELYNAILYHELSHTNKKGFTKEDFLLDIGPSNVSYLKLLVFMIRHPKSLTQFLPFYYKDKSFIYDINMMIAWSVMIIVIGGAIVLSLLL